MTDEDPRYEVDNPEVKAKLKEIGQKIGDDLPAGVGFALFLYGFDEDFCFYIANGDRADVRKMLRLWLQTQGAQ